MSDMIDFLKARRSVKPRDMNGNAPTESELETILTIGARVPDHGKLAPWRFIVFQGRGATAPAPSSRMSSPSEIRMLRPMTSRVPARASPKRRSSSP